MSSGMHSQHCVAFGVELELAADSEPLLALMRESVPFGTHFSAAFSRDARQFKLVVRGQDAGYALSVDGEVVGGGAELEPLREQLARDLMVHVANHAPDRVFLHAGVVGWRGHALVLPGTSFAGKTTLVAELVRCGATYYSDEYAILDEQGLVHPYPRDLQMRTQGAARQSAVAVAELQGSVGMEALPVSHVVFANYVEAGCWRPEPVTAGMAVLEMLRHAIPVQRTPARVMATLGKMMESATALRSERGEASEAATRLLAEMNPGRPAV